MIHTLYFSLADQNYVYYRDYLGKINYIMLLLQYHLSPLFFARTHFFFILMLLLSISPVFIFTIYTELTWHVYLIIQYIFLFIKASFLYISFGHAKCLWDLSSSTRDQICALQWKLRVLTTGSSVKSLTWQVFNKLYL